MDNGEPFKPEISLEEFSVIAEGIKYWESPIIREKIRRCAKYDDFYYILLEVVRKLKETCLPLSIYIKIQNAIIFIGIEMFHWIKYLTSDLNLGLQFTDKMYFTNFGTIDEAKTFQLYWQNDSNLLCDYSNGLPSLYSIACINCQEQFVSDNLNHMREILQNYCGSFLNIPEDVSAYSLMSIWICCYAKKTKGLGCELYKSVVQSEHPEAILLSICSVNGFLNGVKYFGNRLKRERDRLFYSSAELTLKELLNKNERSPDKRDNFIEIIIFLIKEMIPETRSLYFHKNFISLFDTFIYVWPHNKSFLFQLLYCSLPDMQEADQRYLLDKVLNWDRYWAARFWAPCGATYHFIYGITREILGIILKQIPVELKNQMIINKTGDFFKELIYQPDFQTIEVMFKDPYIKTHRHEIVTKKIVEALYPDYVQRINFHYLQKFTEEYLTGDEKDEFKSKFNYAHNFKEILTEGDLDVCKNLMSWKAQSEEEIKNLKRGINAKDVFFNAVSKKHVLPFLSIAEELLNWQFDDDEEQIRAFKERMRSEMTDDFIRTKFYDIWNGHLFRYRRPGPSVNYICSQFLFFIFDKDEAKIFLREKIFEHKSFIRRLTRATLKNMNDLLRFCDLTADEILQIKREILNKVDIFISYFAIKKTQFFMADDLVNWLVSDEDEKKDVIGNFLNSENGVDLCYNLLGPSYGNWFNRLQPAWTFLNSWVKPHGNTSELLSALADRLETAKLSIMREMFRKLEGECLTDSDLARMLNGKSGEHEKV